VPDPQPNPYPEADLAPAEKLAALRQALDQGRLEDAEREWLQLIRGMRGHSQAERASTAKAYAGYTALLRQMGRDLEAGRMEARARMVSDGAQLLQKPLRRESTYNFMKEIRESEGADPGRLAESRRRLDAQIAAAERREKLLKLAAWALAGLLAGPFLGLNSMLCCALGLCLGGAAQHKWFFLRH
jgi:hypothetical protein